MDKAGLVYKIRNIDCQYKSNKFPVLRLKNLDIEEGKVYFIVGSSGVGKSTILETLGVMNNTIRTTTDSEISFYNGVGPVEIDTLWKKGERALAKFRKRNLSFIFQNTNLFTYLTAYQNASISQVLQGKNKANAELKARQLLGNLFEKDFVRQIIKGKKVQEMSGGQRQRLAFARGLGADYKILLADEPTGNLDHHNAQKLIRILTDAIKSENRTAVIVTHDIDLAVTYGDKIVLISRELRQTQEEDLVYGIINADSVFARTNEDSWHNEGIHGIKNNRELSRYLKNGIKETLN